MFLEELNIHELCCDLLYTKKFLSRDEKEFLQLRLGLNYCEPHTLDELVAIMGFPDRETAKQFEIDLMEGIRNLYTAYYE